LSKFAYKHRFEDSITLPGNLFQSFSILTVKVSSVSNTNFPHLQFSWTWKADRILSVTAFCLLKGCYAPLWDIFSSIHHPSSLACTQLFVSA